MRRLPLLLLTCGALSLAALALSASAQDGPPSGGNGGGNPPATRPDGPPPGGFHLLPRFVADKLNLTADQQKQIADLQKDTKAKLDLILTADQKKILEETRPPRRDGPPAGGSIGGPGGQGGGPDGQGGGQGGGQPGAAGGAQGGGQGGPGPGRPPRQ